MKFLYGFFNNMMIHWQLKSFPELSIDELYAILSLRQTVFVVEQNCSYLDADGYDQFAHHVLGTDSNGMLVAYTRIVFPGKKFDEPSIGRVVVNPEFRNLKLGRELMQKSIVYARELYPGVDNRIGAQYHLQKFYESVGYQKVSDPYDEDGIPHIEMLLAG